MTHLRQIMLEELQGRNYCESTIRAYIRTIEHYSRHFHRSRINSVQNIFASIRQPCSASGSWLPIR